MENELYSLLKDEFSLNNEQTKMFVQYASLLKEWNKKINLTALDNDRDIIIKHFYDSLLCTKVWDDFSGKRLIDIGTGGGFPGLPLKILNPELEVTLCDALLKRLNFLEEVIASLELDKTRTLHGRAEDLGKDPIHRETYDLVTARAVAKLPILLELCLPLLKVGGVFIALKGPEGLSELKTSQYALDLLGGKVLDIKDFKLKETNDQRTIMIFKKTFATPKRYPRKAGIPQKRILVEKGQNLLT